MTLNFKLDNAIYYEFIFCHHYLMKIRFKKFGNQNFFQTLLFWEILLRCNQYFLDLILSSLDDHTAYFKYAWQCVCFRFYINYLNNIMSYMQSINNRLQSKFSYRLIYERLIWMKKWLSYYYYQVSLHQLVAFNSLNFMKSDLV